MSIHQLHAPKDREAEPRRCALRQTTAALCDRLIDVSEQARALAAAVRACAGTRTNVAKQRKLLAEQAQRIASFEVFRELVLEDLREAYLEDREHLTRTARLRRLSWLTLFKHFAARRGIERAVAIRALDHQGNYECELVNQAMPTAKRRGGTSVGQATLSPHYRVKRRKRSTQT